MSARTTWLAIALLVSALASGTGAGLRAQSPAQGQKPAETHDHGTPAAPAAQATAPASDMMHAKMMAGMQARQAKLQELVKAMDGATGTAKIETMATIIRELVQHEKNMLANMDTMHAHMMKGHGGQQGH